MVLLNFLRSGSGDALSYDLPTEYRLMEGRGSDWVFPLLTSRLGVALGTVSKGQECVKLWLPPALYAIKLCTLEHTLLV